MWTRVMVAVAVVVVSATLLGLLRRLRGLPNRRFVAGVCAKFVSQQRLRDALLAVDRRHFVPSGADPYKNEPLPIGSNATISAPDVLCIGLDLCAVAIRPGSRVLDVGCGSGYSTALLAEMVGPQGLVVGIDHVPELVELSRSNIAKANRRLLNRIRLVCGDGRKGVPDNAPYDCIYAAAAPQTIPRELVEQLRPGGRLVMPFGPQNSFHQLLQLDKPLDGSRLEPKILGNVRFVPMTDLHTQLQGDTSLHIPVHTTFYPAPDSTPQQIEEIRNRLVSEWESHHEETSPD